MIEIANILLQIFTFLVIFSFPFNEKILNRTIKLKSVNLGLIDAHVFNIIIFLYISLIVSFLNIDIKLFFKIYFTISLIFILTNFKSLYYEIKRSDFIKFAFFFLITISIFIFIAQNIKLEWDGHVWISKALIFFNNEEITKINETFRPDYPHLGSYLWAFFWSNSFLELEYFGRFFHVYLYVLSSFLIFKTLEINNIYIKILLILFFILLTFEPYYFAGYQEYLIFSILIIASRYIHVFNLSDRRNIKLILFAFLILFINCWFKNEGKVYFIIFSSIIIYLSNIDYYKKFLLTLLIISLIITQYILQKYLIGITGSYETSYLINFFQNPNNIEFLFINFFKILLNILIAFIKHPLWVVIFLSIFIQFFFRRKINPNMKYFLICLILNLIIIFGIYIGMQDIDFILRVSLDRILFQTSGFYLILFISILNTKNLLKIT